MRRAHIGNEQGYPAPAQIVEAENQQLEENLSSKVKALKSLTIEMGNEVREQNKFLTQMDDDFSKSGGLLQKSMSKLKEITKKGGPRLWCYLFGFTVFVLFVCWIILKTR